MKSKQKKLSSKSIPTKGKKKSPAKTWDEAMMRGKMRMEKEMPKKMPVMDEEEAEE